MFPGSTQCFPRLRDRTTKLQGPFQIHRSHAMLLLGKHHQHSPPRSPSLVTRLVAAVLSDPSSIGTWALGQVGEAAGGLSACQPYHNSWVWSACPVPSPAEKSGPVKPSTRFPDANLDRPWSPLISPNFGSLALVWRCVLLSCVPMEIQLVINLLVCMYSSLYICAAQYGFRVSVYVGRTQGWDQIVGSTEQRHA